MTPNAPIPGHHLLFEGKTHPVQRQDPYDWREKPERIGGCQCGAKPPNFPAVSAKAMMRWHRDHKAHVRGEYKITVATGKPTPEDLGHYEDWVARALAAEAAVAELMEDRERDRPVIEAAEVWFDHFESGQLRDAVRARRAALDGPRVPDEANEGPS